MYRSRERKPELAAGCGRCRNPGPRGQRCRRGRLQGCHLTGARQRCAPCRTAGRLHRARPCEPCTTAPARVRVARPARRAIRTNSTAGRERTLPSGTRAVEPACPTCDGDSPELDSRECDSLESETSRAICDKSQDTS